jgi:hypothetical protein
MDVLTEGILAPGSVTRTTVMQGHEDDTLLSFFPNGFIVHNGPHISLPDRHAAIRENGALYRIQGPFGEKP